MEPRFGSYLDEKNRCQAPVARLNRLIQWPTAVRPCPPRGGENGRASPLLCPARPRCAWARLHHASYRPLPPSAPISLLASFFTASAAASSSPPPPSPLETPARAWPLQHHRNSSTVSPAPRCFFPCPLTALGKPPQRMQARWSSAVSPVIVATSPQSSSRSDSQRARSPSVHSCLSTP